MNAAHLHARPRAGNQAAARRRSASRWATAVFPICLILGSAASIPAAPSGLPEAADATDGQATAGVWARAAWLMMDRGDHRGARQAFLAASGLAPAMAEPLVGLGMAASRAGHDEEAITWLQEALERDAGAARADRLLGQIHERRGNIRTSLRHFEAALRQDPGDVTAREGALRLRTAVAFDATLDDLYGRHFVVKYPAGADRSLAVLTAARLERIYKTVGRLFAYYPSDPVTVVLYPADQFHAVTASPRWTEGLYDGRMHLPLPARSRPIDEFDASLAHEYAHAVVSSMSAGRAPAWLQEGLAQASEAAVRPARSRQAPAGAPGDPLLLQAHAGSFQGAAAGDAAAAYAESHAMVTHLIRRHGMKTMRRFLTALADDRDFDAAFQSAFGLPWQEAGPPGIRSDRHLLPPSSKGTKG